MTESYNGYKDLHKNETSQKQTTHLHSKNVWSN